MPRQPNNAIAVRAFPAALGLVVSLLTLCVRMRSVHGCVSRAVSQRIGCVAFVVAPARCARNS